MKTVFNDKNTGHVVKSYPMFFGDSLGLVDTVNVVNKEIESLKEKLHLIPNHLPNMSDKGNMRFNSAVTLKYH